MSEDSVLTLSRFNRRGRGLDREMQDRQTSVFLGLSKNVFRRMWLFALCIDRHFSIRIVLCGVQAGEPMSGCLW
jgi:hypothetical protein